MFIRYIKKLLILIVFLSLSRGTDIHAEELVLIKQGGVGHDKGCTVCTLQMIVQNSNTLQEDYQLSGNIDVVTSEYLKFDSICQGYFASGDAWLRDGFLEFSEMYCGGTFSKPVVEGFKSNDYGEDFLCLVGTDNKDFKDMTYEEQVECMKFLYNEGYLVAFCVSYKDNPLGNNGPEGYRANHATMLAEVTKDCIYLADPATGSVIAYTEEHNYQLMYVMVTQNINTIRGTYVEPILDIARSLGLEIESKINFGFELQLVSY